MSTRRHLLTQTELLVGRVIKRMEDAEAKVARVEALIAHYETLGPLPILAFHAKKAFEDALNEADK